MLLPDDVGYGNGGHPAQGIHPFCGLVSRHDFKEDIARFLFAKRFQHDALGKTGCADANRVNVTQLVMKRAQDLSYLFVRHPRQRRHRFTDALDLGGLHMLHQLSGQRLTQTQH